MTGLNISPNFLPYSPTGSGIPPENIADWITQLGPVPGPDAVGVYITPNHALYSPGRTFRLVLQQTDGNLVLQCVDTGSLPPGWADTALTPDQVNWDPIWSPNIQNQDVLYVVMQYDGNLVAYKGGELTDVAWASNTNGNIGAY